MSEQLLLVGSIPLDTPQDVFETFGAPLGRFLSAVPDGEVGPRSHWISRIHYQVFAGHPEFDILAHPRPDNGVERLNPHDTMAIGRDLIPLIKQGALAIDQQAEAAE